MEGERCDCSMKGTENQEGVVFKMVKVMGIIFDRGKKASQYRWLMNHGRNEIIDEKGFWKK